MGVWVILAAAILPISVPRLILGNHRYSYPCATLSAWEKKFRAGRAPAPSKNEHRRESTRLCSFFGQTINKTLSRYTPQIMLEKLKSRAQALQAEVHALLIAFRDPRTPWAARGLIALVAAYALSPIDLIPDFIPVLGYLDDLILVPAGIALAVRMIPPQVLADSREAAQQKAGGPGKGLELVGAGIIVIIWILAIIVLALFIHRLLKEKLCPWTSTSLPSV